jgi:hypothetical protein
MSNLNTYSTTESLNIINILPYEINNRNVQRDQNGIHKMVTLISHHTFVDVIADELISELSQIKHTNILTHH